MRIRALVATAFIATFAAAPAYAHTELVSTNPVDGSVVRSDAVPAAITLTFSEPPLAEGTAIAVTDSTGATLPTSQVTIDGEQVTTAWPAGLTASGKTTVAWRAASDDGHVVSGTFSFTFDQRGGASNPTPLPVTTASTAETSSHGLTGGAAVAVAFLVVAAGAVALLAKRN